MLYYYLYSECGWKRRKNYVKYVIRWKTEPAQMVHTRRRCVPTNRKRKKLRSQTGRLSRKTFASKKERKKNNYGLYCKNRSPVSAKMLLACFIFFFLFFFFLFLYLILIFKLLYRIFILNCALHTQQQRQQQQRPQYLDITLYSSIIYNIKITRL